MPAEYNSTHAMSVNNTNPTKGNSTMSNIKLFRLRSQGELHGYRDVPINWFVDHRSHPLFGINGSLGVEARDLIADYDPSDGVYGTDYLDECFTEDEAKAFTAWLKQHRKTDAAILPVKLPIPNDRFPFGGIPAGGETDFLMIAQSPDYDLKFGVWGFYDLRGGELAS